MQGAVRTAPGQLRTSDCPRTSVTGTYGVGGVLVHTRFTSGGAAKASGSAASIKIRAADIDVFRTLLDESMVDKCE